MVRCPPTLLLAACLALALPAAASAATPDQPLSASQWIARMGRALGGAPSMVAVARLHVEGPHVPSENIHLEIVRLDQHSETRTLIEAIESRGGPSAVSELVVRAGEPLSHWSWQAADRRWLRVQGVLPTDRFLETNIHFEDLGMAPAGERARGTARWVEEGGRRLVAVESPPYHQFQRVVTWIDPESELPVRVLFYDLAGQPYKEQSFDQVKRFDGRPFPTHILSHDRITGIKTSLRIERVHFGLGLPLEVLDTEALEPRLRRGQRIVRFLESGLAVP